MSAILNVNADVLSMVISTAKKITGSTVTAASTGFSITAEGIWIVIPSKNECSEHMEVSFSSNMPIATIKKMKGNVQIQRVGDGWFFSGISQKGVSLEEKASLNEPEVLPEEIDCSEVGTIKASDFLSLIPAKFTGKLPLYLMFSKKTALSLVLNEYSAALSKSKGDFSSLKIGISKDVAAKLSSFLSKTDPESEFQLSCFKCWDSSFIKLSRSDGLAIYVETSSQHIPSYTKMFNPPPVLFSMEASDIQNLLIPKPSIEDTIEIGNGNIVVKAIASSVSSMFNYLGKDSLIYISQNDKFTYFVDTCNHVFVVGNPK